MTLVYLAVAWLSGILIAHRLWVGGWIGCEMPVWPFALLSALAAVAILPFRKRPSVRLLLLLVIAATLGGWRYQAHPFAACPTPGDLAYHNGDEENETWATVEGVMVGYPDVRDVATFYRLRAERLSIAGQVRPVQGDLLVQTTRFPPYQYGDRLRVTGNMQTPPSFDDFDYRAFLARKGIHSLMRRARVERLAQGEGVRFWTFLYGVRARGSALLNRILPEPTAALANGMLLGIESGIPPAVDEAFTATGATHVIVISGSNIALLSGVLLSVLGRLLGQRRAVLPVVAGLTLYVLLVGADAASVRAGIMGGLYVLAIALDRRSTAFVSLFASAFFMTMLNPLTLWDIGFQLSFAATLGLILFTPALQARFEQMLSARLPAERVRWLMGFLNDALVVTLAAQLTTLPLIVYYFGRVSLVSLLTNFLILPAQPPIMTVGMATLVAGLVWEPLGRVLAVIPWLLLSYTTGVVKLTAATPFASLETGALGRTLSLVYYVLLFGWLGARRLAAAGWVHLPSRHTVVRTAAMALPLWLLFTVWQSAPDGKLHVIFIPGERGEAALVRTPRGRTIWLWDGGGDGATLMAGTAPFLPGWGQQPDLVLAPSALSLEAGVPMMDPGTLAVDSRLMLEEGVRLVRLDAGEAWALSLDYGAFRLLLPSTLAAEAQACLVARETALGVTVSKAPGPGTGAWPTSDFLGATAPQLILWPEGTTYPPDIQAALMAAGARRVPADGRIEVITDGRQAWLKLWSESGRR